METRGQDRTPWRVPSNGNAQNCSRSSICRRMLSLAVAVRGRYNSGPRGSRQPRTNQESTMSEPFPGTPPSVRLPEDRLDSWKEIATYLNRDVTTVQRWEKRERMPVHRHLHDRMGSVYAFRADLDAWARSRNFRAEQESGNNALSPNPPAQPPRSAISTSRTRWTFVLPLAAAGVALAIGATPLLTRDFRQSRTSVEWSRPLPYHATVISWRFCRTGTDRRTSGLRRPVLDSSTT